MLESEFQSNLITKIEDRLPGCIVLKNDPNYIQGMPDLTVFYKKRWATLECKKNKNSRHRPNQEYYVEKMNKMSFSSFIFPENEEEVLNELERSLKGSPRRRSCVSRSK
jgi:hypothetical protein